MSKINLLSSQIYNRISAGEVVERPFSVVKELVENSIDAGATEISIDILDGGVSSIVVSDNGSGIEKSELKKALLPHATSKISTVKDLDNITSLGFRGEALASIASVSKIQITSKPKEQEFASKITCDGGLIGQIEDCALNNGTEIIVKNLFYNTPVREKFLKSERAEEGEISSTIARFILSNPQISFKYTANNKVIYQSFGEGFESAMICVYGVDVINNCYYVETLKNGIEIKGYLGKHHFTKGNRSYQTTFINGRFVQNQTVSSAIANAYSNYVMKRQYPFFVLSLTIPTEIVDVNVHPNKLDVRFANNQVVYGSLYSVVSKVLDGAKDAVNIVIDNNNNIKTNTNEIQYDYVKHNGILNEIKNFKQEILETKNSYKFEFKDVASATPSLKLNENLSSKNEKEKAPDIFAENKAFLDSLEKKSQIKQEEILLNRDIKYVGQALNTFLIFEDGIDLYLIDQHAGHERILFDQLNKALNEHEIVSQPLLIPFVLNVNNSEFEFLREKASLLASLGIEISEFGNNSFKVDSVPTFLTEMNLSKFFNEILSEANLLRTITINDLLVEKIAQKACKSAIKSGDKLNEEQIKLLIDKLKDNLALKCPHGRPITVKITRTEIDKWFKRII